MSNAGADACVVVLYKRALRRTDWPVAVQGLRLADEIGDAKNASEARARMSVIGVL